MFKRVRWMSIGAAVGFGGSVWAQRRVRAKVERYLPEQVVTDAGQRARNLSSDVRDALAEGRAAMRAREQELRGRIDGPPELARPADQPVIDRPVIDAVERLTGHRQALPEPAGPGRARSIRGRHRRR